MKAILLAFLLQLEAIGATDPAMYEMGVLARVHDPIHAALVEGRTDYRLPERFGLSSPAAEQQLRGVVENFIRDTRASAEFVRAGGRDEREELLFGDDIETPTGNAYDDYFAFAEASW